MVDADQRGAVIYGTKIFWRSAVGFAGGVGLLYATFSS